MNPPKTGRTCSRDMTVPEKGLEVIQIGREGKREGPMKSRSAHPPTLRYLISEASHARLVRVEEPYLPQEHVSKGRTEEGNIQIYHQK